MIKTRPTEFVDFHHCLMSNPPAGYIPWYFPVTKHDKSPDGWAIAKRAPSEIKKNRGTWKASWACLTFDEALMRLKKGLNIGLAARAEDPLIIIDIDDYPMLKLMPKTLTIISRKRCGQHGFCWKKPSCDKLPLNIPTEYGEVRSADQYVVAAGSFCETNTGDLSKENISESLRQEIIKDPNLGVYGVLNPIPPCFISYEELPAFFLERKKETEQQPATKPKAVKPKGKYSALYDLTIENVVTVPIGGRHPHPLHASETGSNFSVKDGLAHCWRHLVSLNALQYLVVKSGYMPCLDAGTAHKGSGAGDSQVVGNPGAIFYAWREAKLTGLIPSDDPIPVEAMRYIALKHNLIPNSYEYWKLPVKIYNEVLKIVEDEY